MKTLDVSHLPTTGFGSRTPIWWGNALMLTIESAMFAMCAVTYLYLRQAAAQWPPRAVDLPDPWLAAATLAAAGLGSFAMYTVGRSVEAARLRSVRNALLACVACGAVSLAFRTLEMGALRFKWSTHAYGSIFWTTLGLHTAHLLTATLETAAMAYQLFVGPVYVKHLLDIRLTAAYWYWVTAVLVGIDAVLYLLPRI